MNEEKFIRVYDRAEREAHEDVMRRHGLLAHHEASERLLETIDHYIMRALRDYGVLPA